ncbi:AcrB/AcrD/AcrF family protein [Perkinsela sp. CCAP 1560/4]|nr:AcrB/AcrD/AcrF family protein [Perkinsela sp. CCAP 1560/4]|eukprot:KNH09659.1 AcrB/AcrD/AcrF family protein [Perkinsela sp. CCAP 1560/4]
MFGSYSRINRHTALAIGTYIGVGYSIYAYSAIRKERTTLYLDVARQLEKKEADRKAHQEFMEKAESQLSAEWTKLAGFEKTWKDRLMRFSLLKNVLNSYEAQIPYVFAVINDISEKFEAINAGLHYAQEKEFLYSKGNVLSLLISAQSWFAEKTSEWPQNPISVPTGEVASESGRFYHCQNSFLRFLFRSDPFVGAVHRFMESIPDDKSLVKTANASVDDVETLLIELKTLHQEAFTMAQSTHTMLDKLECGGKVKQALHQWANVGGEAISEKARQVFAVEDQSDLRQCKKSLIQLSDMEEYLRKHIVAIAKARQVMQTIGGPCNTDSEKAFVDNVARVEDRLSRLCAQRQVQVARRVSLEALQTFQQALMVNLLSH